MISFLALRNGERLRAGGVQEGVLTAILTWVTERGGRRSEELSFSLSGLETSQPQEEHVNWIEIHDLRPGDEITIRVQDGPGDLPSRRGRILQHKRELDGSPQLKCSFCDRFRSEKGCVAGAEVIICPSCRVLGTELLERHLTSVFHLEIRAGAECSFCFRPDRTASIVAGKVGICSECITAIPFGT